MAGKMHIMIVDDEMIVRESFFHWFEKRGHPVDTAASAREALEKLEKASFDLLFVDIKMPGMSGMELLETVKSRYPDVDVVIITAYGTIDTAVQAMKMGAVDYLLKPFKPDQLTLVMEKVEQQQKLSARYLLLKNQLQAMTRFGDIIGQSAAMETLFDMIPEIAASDAPVLLSGETGTGKELVAKAIHARSRRSELPFVPINCGAFVETLLESELFGYQKGAFTGAVHARKGLLEIVSGGTLFLDEIGEISPKMQVDLLRVLEDKKIRRVGDSHPVEIDFRLISATCRDLAVAMASGDFRSDFYYRINVISVAIPPLRDRKEDIPLLASHFLEKYSRETKKTVDGISPAGVSLLVQYDWPGNVRELENAIERAVVLSRTRNLDTADFAFLQAADQIPAFCGSLREVEQSHIRRVLEECNGNVTQAARILGINRSTLHKKIKRYGLSK